MLFEAVEKRKILAKVEQVEEVVSLFEILSLR